MPTSPTVHEVIEQLDTANVRMLDGDCGLWKELMSHEDDVALLGAYGGHVTGWDEVSARLERTAAGYAGGAGTTTRTNISTWIGADLACVVDLERHETRLDGEPEPTVFVYRTTHLLRRENGEWKVALRHADPLETFRGPKFAHASG